MESLRSLVEKAAADHKRPAREIWRLAVSAILNDELDAQYPRDPHFNSPDIETAHWRRVLQGLLDHTIDSSDPSMVGWTKLLNLDERRWKLWLAPKILTVGGIVAEAPGRKSAASKMIAALDALKQRGRKWSSAKAAHNDVMRHCDITDATDQRGWSYGAFRRAYKTWSARN